MGKQKRARQKYHMACVSGRIDSDDKKSQSGQDFPDSTDNVIEEPCKVEVNENIFKDLEIDVDHITSSFDVEDDRRTVISISKSIKRSIAQTGSGIHLKKKEKRDLRRNLFIGKIDAIHKVMENDKKAKKGCKSEQSMQKPEDLPRENMLFFKSSTKGPKPVSTKLRPIAKAPKRKQEMLKNLDAFKKVMSDTKFSSDALGIVTDRIQQKVFNEEL